MVTRNLSIMFTDIKGFTQRTSASSRDAMKALLEQHEKLLLPVFAYFDGTVVKTIGDAFLVYFESPTDAVLCGVTIQEVLRQHNTEQAEDARLEVRVAINVGEVELEADDVLGEAVNIAARLEGVTEAGEVWFTDAVYQTMNRNEAPSAEVGERLFKGIPHPIRVYKVIQDSDSELAHQLSQGVMLSGGVPQLTGIRLAARGDVSAEGGSRCRKTLLASVVVLLISALVVFFMPSTQERALDRIAQLMGEGQHEDALTIADKLLKDNPENAPMRRVALAAARARMDELVDSGDVRAAQGWIHRQLEAKPYLETLRDEEMQLEALLAVNLTLSGTRYANDTQPEPLQQFLDHYATSTLAPQLLLKQLMGKDISRQARLWLMETAVQRGATPDASFFNFYTEQLEYGAINQQFFTTLREHLLAQFSQQGQQWAESRLDSDNPQAFQNAWRYLLEQKGSGKLADPYYLSLYELIGAVRLDALSRGRLVFSRQEDVKRRQHLLAFLNRLIETFPEFINSTFLRDEIARYRDELRNTWKL